MPDTYPLIVTHISNLVTAITPVTTSQSTVYPTTNLNILPITKPWRSSGSSWGSPQITVDFTTARAIDVIALVNHNLSSAATITIDAGTTASYADFTTSMTWKSKTAHKWLSPVQTYRYWRISITDTANTDGFLEVGYLVLSSATLPSFTFRHGWISTPEIATSEVHTEFGSPFHEELYQRQRLNLQFGPLNDTNMDTLRNLYISLLRNANPMLLLPERNGTDSYFGRIENQFDEKINFRRAVSIDFVEDSVGQRLAT